MSAIWLPKGRLWGTEGVTFGTLGVPWWPQGAKTRPWKGKNRKVLQFSHILGLSWGSHWNHVKGGKWEVMRPFGFARG